MLDVIIAVLMLATALPAICFPILYAIFAPWRSTLAGRHMMTFAISMAAIMLLVVGNVFGVDYPGRGYIRAGIWALLAFLFWQRIYVFMRVQLLPQIKDERKNTP